MDATKGAGPLMDGAAREKLRARFGLLPVPVAPHVIPGWAARIEKWLAS